MRFKVFDGLRSKAKPSLKQEDEREMADDISKLVPSLLLICLSSNKFTPPIVRINTGLERCETNTPLAVVARLSCL
jgi:hypothetical protein